MRTSFQRQIIDQTDAQAASREAGQAGAISRPRPAAVDGIGGATWPGPASTYCSAPSSQPEEGASLRQHVRRENYALAERELVGFSGSPLREAVILPCGHVCDLWEAQQSEKKAAGFRSRSLAQKGKDDQRSAELAVSAEQTYVCVACPATHRTPIGVAAADLRRARDVNEFMQLMQTCMPKGAMGASGKQVDCLTARLKQRGLEVPTLAWHARMAGILPPPPELCSSKTGILLSLPCVDEAGRLLDYRDDHTGPVYPCKLSQKLIAIYRSHRALSSSQMCMALAREFRCAQSGRFLLEPGCDKVTGQPFDFAWRSSDQDKALGETGLCRNHTLHLLGERLLEDPAICTFAAATFPPVEAEQRDFVALLSPQGRVDLERAISAQMTTTISHVRGGDLRRAETLCRQTLEFYRTPLLLEMLVVYLSGAPTMSFEQIVADLTRFGNDLAPGVQTVLLLTATNRQDLTPEDYARFIRTLHPILQASSKRLVKENCSVTSTSCYTYHQTVARRLVLEVKNYQEAQEFVDLAGDWAWQNNLARYAYIFSQDFKCQPLSYQLAFVREQKRLDLEVLGEEWRQYLGSMNIWERCILEKMNAHSGLVKKKKSTCAIM